VIALYSSKGCVDKAAAWINPVYTCAKSGMKTLRRDLGPQRAAHV